MKYIRNPKNNIPLWLALALTSTASAAPITWSGATDSDYATDTNWVGDLAPTDDLTTDIATFVGGTVDLSTTRQVAGLDFSTASTLSGIGSIEIGTGGINLGDNSILDTAALVLNQPNTTITFTAGRLTWGTSLTASGTGALTVTGNNTLFIDGVANTYAGGTTITGGASIGMKNGDALGTGGLILDNGILFTNGSNFTFDEPITVNAGGGTIDGNNNTIELSGTAVISGAGAMTFKANSVDGIKFNNPTNTYTGGTTIDGTKVWLKSGANLSTGDITLINGGTIKNSNSNPTLPNNIIVEATGGAIESGWNNRRVTLNGVISGAGELTINNDSSEVRIYGTANTYSGGTKILGSLAAQNAASLGTGPITFDGGFLRNNNSNIDLGARDITIEAGGAEINVGWSGKRISMDGVVSGTGAITVMDDSSSLNLSNTNTYSGGTEIRGFVQASTDALGTGDVTLNNIPFVETVEAVQVATDRGRGQLKNNGGETILTNNVIISDPVMVDLDAVPTEVDFGGRMMAGWDSNLEISGVVSGAGKLTVVGDSGTVVLSNTANTFTGDIDLLDANSRLRVASLGTTGTYSGNVSGLGVFDYAFATTPILDGTYTHTGGTAISLVTVSATDFPTLNCFNGDQDIILATGGALDLAGTVIGNGFINPAGGTLLNSGAAVDLSANSFTSNGGTFTVDGTGDITLGEMIYTAGNPTVVKDGANTLTLTGIADNIAFRAEVNDGTLILAKTSSGSVHAIGGLLTINGGTAELGGTGNDQLYLQSTVTVNTSGTFDLNTRNERIKFLNLYGGDITGTGVLTVNSSGGGTPLIDAQSGTIAAGLSGDAPLVKSTTGTVTITGTANYSGDTTVTEGTLSIANDNTANDATSVVIASGAFLNLDFVGTDTVDTLFLAGAQQDSGVYDASNTGGAITGTGSLTVSSGPPAGFSGWVTGTFANGTIDGGEQDPNDDPDGDGISNLLEYAIDGQDPTVANSTISSFVDNLLSFTKNAAATGLTYSIEESTDLGDLDDWTEVSGVEYTNDGTTISYDLPVGLPKNFIRLNVTED